MIDDKTLREFAPKREVPVQIALIQAIQNKVDGLRARNRELGASEVGDGFVDLANHPVVAVVGQPEGVDTVAIRSLSAYKDPEGSVVGMNVLLYADGSPFAREDDLDNSAGSLTAHSYDLYVLPEVPPFLIFDDIKLHGPSGVEAGKRQFEPLYAYEYLNQAAEGGVPQPLWVDDALTVALLEGVSQITADDVQVLT